ncbi:DivIVA domain-containing protein [Georgenia faecalis]|uniref:Cell wall synthesis protein Wag31 n=1 Tax=Georgenia faecalis TaxID=2483799 RepID=A0ABV9DC95_9MICO|nr:DivIVA domain-containing protein [Georgenia faecalis]
MALLTADDVLNKKFQPTKFREGYDQDEVDDFLDEVVNTLSALATENEELKAKLAAAERRVAELNGGAAVSEDVAPAEVETEDEPEREESAFAPRQEATPAPVATPTPVVTSTPAPAADGPESATGMLALAQRLHDEYVRNGQEEGDRILTDARTQAEKIVREAEDKHNRTLAQLEQERSLLERKIDELRVFERDYRTRLKSYLESLLSDIEGRGAVAGRPEAEAPQYRK